jgi:hypothetical protein
VEEDDVECLCDRELRESGADKQHTCSFKTRLSMMLTELPTLGRWRLETSGKIAGDELPAIIDMMGSLGFTSGPVFCILTLTQQEIKRPGKKPSHFAVPVLTLDPNPPSLAQLIHDVQRKSLEPAQAPALTAGNPALNGPLTVEDKAKAHRLKKEEATELKIKLAPFEKKLPEFLASCYDSDQIGFAAVLKVIGAMTPPNADVVDATVVE